MSVHLVFCTHNPHEEASKRPSRPDLQMTLEDETQFRLAGYIQAVIEEHAEQLKEEQEVAQRLANDSSDGEMDEDGPAVGKRKGRRAKDDALLGMQRTQREA
jgi:cohesin complex subunit SA-1/2